MSSTPTNSPHVAIAALIVTLSCPAMASSDVALSTEYARCESKSGGVTASLQECLSAEYRRQDLRLNAAYKALLEKISPVKAEELRKVQRAWLAYVDAKCGYLFDEEDFNGSMDRLEAQHCQVAERARRARELEALLTR